MDALPHADQRARLAALLAERFGAAGVRLTPIDEEPAKAVYRADVVQAHPRARPKAAEATSWVVRHFPPDRPLERVRGDGVVLRYLEQHSVPAERVVDSCDGALTTELDGRGVLVTTFVHGTRPNRSAATLQALGDALGRLHALPPVPASDSYLMRRAGALPREDLAYGRTCLASIAEQVPMLPRLFRALYDTVAAALDTTHGGDLPVSPPVDAWWVRFAEADAVAARATELLAA